MTRYNHNYKSRRRGSVLILVVGILVLLALMGTAYISAVRIDRVAYTGAAAVTSTPDVAWPPPPADLMNNAMNAILGDVADPLSTTDLDFPQYSVLGHILRDLFPNDDPADPAGFKGAGWRSYDAYRDDDNFWVSSRIPKNDVDWTDPTAGSWPTVTRIFKTGATTYVPFATPYDSTGNTATYTAFQDMKPTSVTITYPASLLTPVQLAGKTRVYPALQIGGAGTAYLAADCDGDGIADSPLYDMSAFPGAVANYLPAYDPTRYSTTAYAHNQPSPALAISRPVRMYAAVKVVDNSAAINLNTAYSLSDTNYTGAAAPNYGFFRANIAMFPAGNVPTSFTDPNGFAPTRFGATPGTYSKYASGRTDFEFTTYAEMLDTQVGRAFDFPGLNANGQAPQGFGSGTAVGLAYHGGLLKPATDTTALENALYDVMYFGAPNFAQDPGKRFPFFAADSVQMWYESAIKLHTVSNRVYNGYTYSTPGLAAGEYPTPMRSQFVCVNPLTNLAPYHEIAANQPLVPTPAGGGTPGVEYMPNYTLPMARVCANTATFGELWRGFWNVMCDPANVTSTVAPLGSASTFTVQELLALRAAQAAVNALDMRDTDNDITKRTVEVKPGVFVTVYGTEEQPFIVAFDPDAGTVTLRNPYSHVLSLQGYVLGTLAGGVITPLPGIVLPPTLGVGPTDVNIPPGQPVTAAVDIVLARPLVAGGATAEVAVDGVSMNGFTPGLGQTYTRGGGWACGYGSGSISTAPAAGEFPIGVPNLPSTGLGGTTFPFGGFARAGDIMLVPYVSSYKISGSADGSPTELMPVTRDAATITYVPGQMLARFVMDPGTPTYWANDLFDFFTAQTNPNSDYLPNVVSSTFNMGTAIHPVQNIAGLNSAEVNGVPENSLPIHGLINVNMASREVLNQMPLVVKTADGTVDIGTPNQTVADAIHAAAQTTPFMSLVELQNVGVFSGANPTENDQTGVFITDTAYAPFNTLRNVNRLSNIATVRSDSFTVYAVVQAWQDAAGTEPPVLLGEKRVAYLVDRSGVTKASASLPGTAFRGLKLTPIDND